MKLIKYRIHSLMNFRFLKWNVIYFILFLLYQCNSIDLLPKDNFHFINLLMSKFTLTYIVLPMLSIFTLYFYNDDHIHETYISHRKYLKIDYVIYATLISSFLSVEQILASLFAEQFIVKLDSIFWVSLLLTIIGNLTVSLLFLSLYVMFFNKMITLIVGNLMIFLDFLLGLASKTNFIIIDSSKLITFSFAWVLYKCALFCSIFLIAVWQLSKKEILK